MFEKKIREIPLSNEMEKRHLGFVVGILVFLVVIILSLSVSMSGSFFNFQHDQTHRLTVKIPTKNLDYIKRVEVPKDVVEGENLENEEKFVQKEQMCSLSFDDVYQKVLDVLKNTPSVVRFEKTHSQDVSPSLKKWVSQDVIVEDDSLSIDVDFLTDKAFCLDTFSSSLRDVHPKITVDYNEKLQSVFKLLSLSLRIFSILLVGIVTFCIFLLVTLITKASLKTHLPIIDILRLLGAKNSYIVKVYQFQVFKSVFIGSLLGAIFSFPVIYAVKYFIDYLGLYFFAFKIFTIQNLEIFLLVPFFMAFLSFIITRVVVLRELRNLFSYKLG